MSEDEVSVNPYGQLDDEQDELLDEETMPADDLDDADEYDEYEDDDGLVAEAEDFDDAEEPEDASPLATEEPAAALEEPLLTSPVADERLEAIQAAIAELAASVAGLSTLTDGMTEVRERLASIEARVVELSLQQEDEPSIAALLGDAPPPPPAGVESGERDESLADIIGTAPLPLRATPPAPQPEPDPEPVAPAEPIVPILEPMPGIDEYARRFESEPALDVDAEHEFEPEPLPAPAPEVQPLPPPQPQITPAAEQEIAPEPQPEPPRQVEPVPIRPAAFSPPEPAPAPPAPAPTPAPAAASDGRFGLGSSVSLRVAPVAGFQELTRVQGALSQARVVRRATVEAYSRGEARLVVELAEATSATSLAESLGANLNRVAVVREVSEEQQMMKIMLG